MTRNVRPDRKEAIGNNSVVAHDAKASEPILLNEFFERQVLARPGHPAVECNGRSMTYAQLDEQANRIANLLRSRGVRPGCLVALYMNKSCRLFAGLLGVLKAGAGYLPLDAKFPIKRIRAILEDAGVTIVLSEGAAGETLAPHVSAEIISLDKEQSFGPVSAMKPIIATPNDICYVIYTSGSTGTPKGVLIEHRNAVNFIRAMHKVYGVSKDDRIYQGFSIAFDASVEEVWAAFSLGGTLVIPSEEVSRSPQDAADFIAAQRITYFSTVPSFLALMKPGLPSLRLLVVGGEACQPELVSRWARPGLRMLNTYGPTESTVVATTAECIQGEPVTIGMAMPGYETYVLDDNLQPAKPGECAELYIGGESVARGYMNRPELTAERFICNPFATDETTSARLYRTYDLVRLAEDGRIHFVGRADGQLKIRGFRVELSEIEAVLMEHPSIRLAAANAVDVAGSKELAAYVVLAQGVAELERKSVSDLLRKHVPEYMVPKFLDIVDELPTATSGKVDRKMLPVPHQLLNDSKRHIVPPANALQRTIVAAWEQALAISPVSIHDDFFLDLHGHSLTAAKVVTELREKFGSVQISVRDLYQYRTIEKLAEHLASVGVNDNDDKKPIRKGPDIRDVGQPPLPRARWICVILQFISLIAFYGVASGPAVFAVILILRVLSGTIKWYEAADLATVVAFAIWPTWLALSIAVKWIVIGRYKAGRYPVWGFYYFRWWLVNRFQVFSWSQMFNGTPLMSLYYRSMGAKVGKNCIIATPLCTAFDLVNIGDNTSIGVDTHMLGYRVEDGYLILGNATIGDDCFVGTHCCLGLDTTMHDRSRLDDMSLLADKTVLAEGRGLRGSPAMAAEVKVPPSPRRRPRWGMSFIFGLIHLALIYAMGYLLIFSAVPAVALVAYALYFSGPVVGIIVSFATVPVSILWYLQLVIFAKNIAIGRIFPGTYSLHSVAYLRYWFLTYLLNNTRQIVLPLYATVFLPRFLRHLGAKIGRMVEVSTVMHAMPDLLEIDDGSFLADACIVGGQRIYDGVIELSANKIGKRSFVGNSAFVPSGVDLGNNGLVGVMSTPPVGLGRTPDGTRWLGSPGFELPGTLQTSCFGVRQTFEPSIFLICMRTVIDLLRVLLPGFTGTAGLVLFSSVVVALDRSLPLLQVVLIAPVVALVLSFISLVGVAGLKKILMGKFAPTQKPLWSFYVWINEVVNAQYETVAGAALTPLLGTPFIAFFLRLIGCKIGRWVFLESTLMSEFDLVRIGDRASINLGCTIQPHLFEDRIMKADTITIGDGCSVGNMAVVLYNTQMHAGSSLGPLSVLMKGEGLPAGTRWYGIPTQPIAAQADREEDRNAAPQTSALQTTEKLDQSPPSVPESEPVSTVPELAS